MDDGDFLDHLEHLRHLEHLVDIALQEPQRKRSARMDPFKHYNDQEFVERYSLTKACTRKVLEAIEDHLPDLHNNRGSPLLKKTRLLLALRYMATGNFQPALADCDNVSQSSVSRFLTSVSDVIAQQASKFIIFPEPGEEEEEAMRKFAEVANMPGVLGCIGGVHIRIKNSGREDLEWYRCEDGYLSLNVMGVCDAALKFTSLVASYGGSVCDAEIFSKSTLCEKLEQGSYKGYLLGDNAYACQPYLLTPIQNPEPGKQSNYNESHRKTSSLIEKAFGVLINMWGVLSGTMRVKLETSKNIVVACAVMHNIAIDNGLKYELPGDNLLKRPGNSVFPEDYKENDKRRSKVIEDHF